MSTGQEPGASGDPMGGMTDRRRGTNGGGDEEKPRKTLNDEGAIKQLKGDLCRQVDQVAHAFLAGVNASGGAESAEITFKCQFLPGGAQSRSRFQIDAKLTTKVPTIQREAAMQDEQICMFKPEKGD